MPTREREYLRNGAAFDLRLPRGVVDYAAAACLAIACFWGTASGCDAPQPEDYLSSIAYFTELIRIDPLPNYHYHRAEAYLSLANMGRLDLLGIAAQREAYDRALADYSAAVRLSGGGGGGRWFRDDRGLLHLRMGQYKDAADDFTAALSDPRDRRRPHDRNRFLRGVAYYLAGDFDRATEDFETVRRLDSDYEYRGGGRHDLIMVSKKALAFAKERPAGSTPRVTAGRHYMRGLAAFVIYLENCGAADFLAAKEADPANAAEYDYMAAKAYIRHGSYDEHADNAERYLRAMAHITDMIRRNPDSASFHALKGEALREMRYYHGEDEAKTALDSAVNAFSEAIRLAPNNAEYYFQRGRTIQQGYSGYSRYTQTTNAIIADYMQAAKLAPESNFPFLFYNQKAKSDFYLELTQLYPNNAAYHAKLGESYYYSRDLRTNIKFDLMINAYEMAILLAPPGGAAAEYYYMRSLGHLENKNYNEAVDDVSRAIELAPDVAMYHFKRGDLRHKGGIGGRAEVVADFVSAYKLGYDNFGYDMANDMWIEIYSQLITDDPQNAAHYRERSGKYLAAPTVDRSKALADINEAIRLARNDAERAEYFGMRTVIHVEMGDTAKGAAAAARMLQLSPSAEIRAGMGLWMKALDDLIRRHPGEAEYYNMRGKLRYTFSERQDYDKMTANLRNAPYVEYFGKESFDLALADFNEAIRLRPEEAAYYKSRGDMFLRKGDREKALADHIEAVRLRPESRFYLLAVGHDHGDYPEEPANPLNAEYMAAFAKSIADLQFDAGGAGGSVGDTLPQLGRDDLETGAAGDKFSTLLLSIPIWAWIAVSTAVLTVIAAGYIRANKRGRKA